MPPIPEILAGLDVINLLRHPRQDKGSGGRKPTVEA
jgi:hypothetical protein